MDSKIYYFFINITYKSKTLKTPKLCPLGVVCSVKLTKDIVKINLIKVFSKHCKKRIFSEKLNNTAKSLIKICNNYNNISKCKEVVLDNPFNSIVEVNRELVHQVFNEDIKQICSKRLSDYFDIISSFLI